MIETITMSNPNEFHAIECKKKYLSPISGSTTEPYSRMHFAWTIDFGSRIQKPFYKNKHEMSSLH